jgi:hypothetical protein
MLFILVYIVNFAYLTTGEYSKNATEYGYEGANVDKFIASPITWIIYILFFVFDLLITCIFLMSNSYSMPES